LNSDYFMNKNMSLKDVKKLINDTEEFYKSHDLPTFNVLYYKDNKKAITHMKDMQESTIVLDKKMKVIEDRETKNKIMIEKEKTKISKSKPKSKPTSNPVKKTTKKTESKAIVKSSSKTNNNTKPTSTKTTVKKSPVKTISKSKVVKLCANYTIIDFDIVLTG